MKIIVALEIEVDPDEWTREFHIEPGEWNQHLRRDVKTHVTEYVRNGCEPTGPVKSVTLSGGQTEGHAEGCGR
jgi:hypothetical protein